MLNDARIRWLYGSIYPAWEYELIDGQRTGRKRARQFVSYPRPWDVRPIVPRDFR